MRNLICVVACVAMASIAAGPTIAGGKHEHRDAKAHVHGHGTLSIAIEDNKVAMELEAPGSDIVGFEHAAKTKSQKTAVEKAKATLLNPLDLIVLPDAAGCKLETAKIDVEQSKDDHSEFHAAYTFQCSKPGAMTSIAFPYFKTFAGAKELTVNVISDKGQSKFEATRKKPRVDLSGMM